MLIYIFGNNVDKFFRHYQIETTSVVFEECRYHEHSDKFLDTNCDDKQKEISYIPIVGRYKGGIIREV